MTNSSPHWYTIKTNLWSCGQSSGAENVWGSVFNSLYSVTNRNKEQWIPPFPRYVHRQYWMKPILTGHLEQCWAVVCYLANVSWVQAVISFSASIIPARKKAAWYGSGTRTHLNVNGIVPVLGSRETSYKSRHGKYVHDSIKIHVKVESVSLKNLLSLIYSSDRTEISTYVTDDLGRCHQPSCWLPLSS